MRGHTDRAEAEMAVHVAALTKPVGELIEAVLRKHHRAVLEAVKELHERCAKAELERDAARDSLSRLQQTWAVLDRNATTTLIRLWKHEPLSNTFAAKNRPVR